MLTGPIRNNSLDFENYFNVGANESRKMRYYFICDLAGISPYTSWI